MTKQVFIINGSGGVGKDTVCSAAAQSWKVQNISSITPILQVAKAAGWEEIERFRQTAGVNCKTILVRRPTLEQARGQLGNRSDDGVAAYAYDAEFLNDGSLEELPAKVHDFLQALIKR